jgi:HEAT repeat protein
MSSFQDKLRRIAQAENIHASSLTFLSDLSSEDRAILREAWPQFPAERRRRIVSDLVTMAEDNIELDFRQVFLISLEDSDAQVRLTAIEGLYEDESKLLLGKLVRILRNDPNTKVREAAASALGRFTYRAQCEQLAPPQAEALRQALLESARDQNEKPDVRRRAIEALGYLDGDGEVEALIAEAYERGGTQAESALFAMGRSMDPRWTQIVLDELQSDKPAMRYEAARAAGEMVLEEALPQLVRMVNDKDPEVRLAAVWALGQIGGKPAAEALAPVLNSPEPAMREAAQEAMEEIAFASDPLKFAGDFGTYSTNQKPKST